MLFIDDWRILSDTFMLICLQIYFGVTYFKTHFRSNVLMFSIQNNHLNDFYRPFLEVYAADHVQNKFLPLISVVYTFSQECGVTSHPLNAFHQNTASSF